MSIYDLTLLPLARIPTYPLARPAGKVTVREFARPHRRGAGIREWLDSLPHILAGESMREVVGAIAAALIEAAGRDRRRTRREQ